jgi:hypothetical protein
MICDWIGKKNLKFNLLTRGSVDGFHSNQFNDRCVKKGPLLVIIQVNEYIFGGYCSIDWPSKCSSAQDDEAFIYSLNYKMKLIPVSLKEYCLRNAAGHYLDFGYGGGIRLLNNCNVGDINTQNLSGTYDLPDEERGTRIKPQYFAGT